MENNEKTTLLYQKIWLEELTSLLMVSMGDPRLRAEDLADKMFLSRSQFYRKVKEYTGMPPGSFIREKRLLEAKKILEGGMFPTVKEVAHQVGYCRMDYFSKLFRERFGKLPSEVLKH